MNKVLSSPVFIAALHSFWITALGMVCGIYVDAVANGAVGSPAILLAYYKAHAWAWLIANIVTPAVRAYIASQKGS